MKRAQNQFESLEHRRLLAINVTTFNDVVNAGDGLTSLREAIAAAAAKPGSDTIKLPAGTYPLALGTLVVNDTSRLEIEGKGAGATINGTGQRVFSIQSQTELEDLTITGGFTFDTDGAGIANSSRLKLEDCTVTGNNTIQGRGAGIFNSSTGQLTLEDCTVTGNSTVEGPGAGIFNNGGQLSLDDCTFTSNTGAAGAAIFSTGGSVKIEESTFSGNSAQPGLGGGVVELAGGSARIDESLFFDNTGGNQGGGAIKNTGATLRIDQSTFHDNRPGLASGGAINLSGGATTVTASTFYKNVGRSGGAIDVVAPATLTATNSTFDSNSGGLGAGGAISNFGGTVTLNSCTITRNDSFFSGGGIVNNSGTFNVGNSLIALNTAQDTFAAKDASGTFVSKGYNLIGNGDGSTGFTATGDQVGTTAAPIDPKVGALADNGGPTQTVALLAGSPAINKGDPNLKLHEDQRGVHRPQGGRADIGAFEVRAKPIHRWWHRKWWWWD